MALFGTPNAFLGIDLGTSSLKIVELIRRKQRIELATYAQADVANWLVSPPDNDEASAVDRTANLISNMMDKANVSTDVVVAALPSSVVFSTVITMPPISDEEMEKAVRFAARDIVPADLDDMVLGWSRADELPHMSGQKASPPNGSEAAANPDGSPSGHPDIKTNKSPQPVFLTAAPRKIVSRYLAVMKKLELKLFALEVETFPLARSLLHGEKKTALIVDIGDRATTYHIIDHGTPYVSNSIDFGGHDLTTAIAAAGQLTPEQAENQKMQVGLGQSAPTSQQQALEQALATQTNHAQKLIKLYEQKHGRPVSQSILMGGGAALVGLSEFWEGRIGHPTSIGNPWAGLSYPAKLENNLRYIGPTYGVGVGLALRGFMV